MRIARWCVIGTCLAVLMAGVAVGQTKTIGLVVNSASSNPYGNYLVEILKTEGFRDMQTEALSGLTLAKLQSYGTIVLAETALSASQAQLFRDYVSAGGKLIGMRPDSKLDDVFGISRTSGTVSDGYTKIIASTPIGAGLETSRSMKTHGVSDLCGLAGGATKVASLYSNASTDTGYASVVRSAYGSGQAAAFSYDLAKSVSLMRQGNPDWTNEDRDVRPRVRPADMFYDTAPRSAHWNDNTRSDILQADEQMRLLTRLIEALNASRMPLPRLWYFPDAKKSMLVWTGDQDGGAPSVIDNEFNTVKSRGGRASIYLTLASNPPTAAQVNTWTAAGHELGVHFVSSRANSPTWAEMNGLYESGLASFRSSYSGVPTQQTVRNHSITWCGADAAGQQDLTAQAKIEAKHGIQMDFNYYYLPGSWQGTSGYSIPSGLPMRFATTSGQVLDIYQADTQLPDETWREQISQAYQSLLNASVHQGKYAWVVANFHPAGWTKYASQGEAVLDHAVANNIPIWSGAQMNAFVRMRDAADFQNVQWKEGTLSFVVNAPGCEVGALTVMVPKVFGGHVLAKTSLAGLDAAYSVETIAGSDYALFTIRSGMHFVIAVYTSRAQ
jgi:hypothetical protein